MSKIKVKLNITYAEVFFGYTVHALIPFDVFVGVGIEFVEFFGYVRTYIAVSEKENS